MGSAFCAFTRHRRAMEIMPMVQFSNLQIQNQLLDTIKTAASVANPKDYIKFKQKFESGAIIGADDDYSFETVAPEEDALDSSFMPFFNM